MEYKILKEIYSKAKEKIGNYFHNLQCENVGSVYEEEMTQARIAVLLGKCVEDLPEKKPANIKESALEGRVK